MSWSHPGRLWHLKCVSYVHSTPWFFFCPKTFSTNFCLWAWQTLIINKIYFFGLILSAWPGSKWPMAWYQSATRWLGTAAVEDKIILWAALSFSGVLLHLQSKCKLTRIVGYKKAIVNVHHYSWQSKDTAGWWCLLLCGFSNNEGKSTGPGLWSK